MVPEAGDGVRTHDPQLGKLIQGRDDSGRAREVPQRLQPCGIAASGQNPSGSLFTRDSLKVASKWRLSFAKKDNRPPTTASVRYGCHGLGVRRRRRDRRGYRGLGRLRRHGLGALPAPALRQVPQVRRRVHLGAEVASAGEPDIENLAVTVRRNVLRVEFAKKSRRSITGGRYEREAPHKRGGPLTTMCGTTRAGDSGPSRSRISARSSVRDPPRPHDTLVLQGYIWEPIDGEDWRNPSASARAPTSSRNYLDAVTASTSRRVRADHPERGAPGSCARSRRVPVPLQGELFERVVCRALPGPRPSARSVQGVRPSGQTLVEIPRGGRPEEARMHGRMARYTYTGDAQELARKAEDGMLPIFQAQPGFKSTRSSSRTGRSFRSARGNPRRPRMPRAGLPRHGWPEHRWSIQLQEKKIGEILLGSAIGVSTKAGTSA